MSYTVTLLSIQDRKYIEQYPINHTEDVLKKYTYKLNSTQHIFVEKRGRKVSYTYLRRMNNVNTDYFGFCFVFIDEYIENIKGFFEICEELIEKILKQGELLQGSLPFDLSRNNAFETKSPEVKRISLWFDELIKLKTNFLIPFKDINDDSSNIDVPFSKTDEDILFAIRNYNSINYYANTSINALSNALVQEDTINSSNIEEKQEKSRKNIYKILFFICCIILLVAIVISISSVKQNTENKHKIEQVKLEIEKQNELQKRQKEQRDREEVEKQIAEKERLEKEKLPEILKLEIANTNKGGSLINSYGGMIYSRDTKYLKPRISYKAYDSRQYKFDIKWIKPDGTLRYGDSSPAGYSQSRYYALNKGYGVLELDGWGNDIKGHWKAGNYAIEIWCNGVLLIRKNFDIFKKSWW